MIKSIYTNLIKYPISSSLNLLSLVIAFSGIITLVLYVNYETSFDRHHLNYDQIYQLQDGKEESTLPAVVTPLIRNQVPAIEFITPVWFSYSWISVIESDKKIEPKGISSFYANNDLLSIFSFDFIYGNPEKALSNSNALILTEELAKQLFGNMNPVGHILNVNDEEYTCTAVIAGFPKTSTLQTQCIISFETLLKNNRSGANSWSEWSYRIYAKLFDAKDRAKVSQKINGIEEIKDLFKEEGVENNSPIYLSPLKDWHYNESRMFKSVNMQTLKVLILLTFILGLMGIVNFINLLTSQSIQRAKAFAIKRVIGASRSSAIQSIILESIFISLLALSIALLLHQLSYSFIENLFRIEGLSLIGRSHLYIYFVFLAVVYGVIASIYPAQYITSVKVAQAIKGNYLFSGKGKNIRNILLILQFAFTTLLIIGSMAIEKQISYWHNFDTGFQKENVIYVHVSPDIIKHQQAFTKELLSHQNITEHCYSQHIPGQVGMSWGRNVDGQHISMTCWPVDEHFLSFFDIEIVEGRAFSKNLEADKDKYIINQAAVEKFNWDKPLEKIIEGFGFEGSIIGVAKNVNFASLKENIAPMQFWLTDTRHNIIMLKVTDDNISSTIDYIHEIWYKFEKNIPIDVRFLDESMDRLYNREEGIAYFIEFVALWCILLSLTGLLGLSIFIARQRTKEIGIRRSNGASISEILRMLNYDFLKWISIAFIIAIPISYYAIKQWQNNFAYKAEISWCLFVLAGLLTFTLSITAVTAQTLRIARKNPVKALRHE